MIEELKKLLASRISGYVELETVEVSHPDFSKTYYLVRNMPEGFAGKLEDGRVVHFQYCPMRWERGSADNNLDYELKLTFQDLNNLIAPEVERIPIESENTPTVIVRSFVYKRDKTISEVADGPFVLSMRNITFTGEGCAFAASAKPLNSYGSGELYTFKRFEVLRGFVT